MVKVQVTHSVYPLSIAMSSAQSQVNSTRLSNRQEQILWLSDLNNWPELVTRHHLHVTHMNRQYLLYCGVHHNVMNDWALLVVM